VFDVANVRVVRTVQRDVSSEVGEKDVAALAAALKEPERPERIAPSGKSTKWQISLRPRTWLTASVGAALLVGAGVMGGLTLKAQSDFDAMQTPSASDPEAVRAFVDQADKGKRYAIAANVLFACGGAAMAVSAFFFVRDMRRVEVVPSVGRKEAGLSIVGTF